MLDLCVAPRLGRILEVTYTVPDLGVVEAAYTRWLDYRVTARGAVSEALARDWEAFSSAVTHLILPVATLGLINAGPILKMTQSTVERMLHSDFSRFEVLSGMPRGRVIRSALRNALPSVVTIIGVPAAVPFAGIMGAAVVTKVAIEPVWHLPGVARRFAGEESIPFLNGVLDAINLELRRGKERARGQGS